MWVQKRWSNMLEEGPGGAVGCRDPSSPWGRAALHRGCEFRRGGGRGTVTSLGDARLAAVSMVGTEEGREAAGRGLCAAAGARRDLRQNPSRPGDAEQMEGDQLPADPALRRAAPGCQQAQELLIQRGERTEPS